MYTFLNFIINLFISYSSLFHFYTLELSEDIYFFEFINSIILFIILFFLFFRFLIKRYTFKILCVFIVKRIFFTTLLFFLFYFFSGFMYCETPINKCIKSFINNDTKKYLCIATMTITSCYVVYKYIPALYISLKSYDKYKNYIFIKNEYSLNYNINNDIIGENNLIEMPLYLKDLKILIDNTLYSSNQLLSGIESISTFPLVTDCLQFNLNLKEVEKPLEIIDIDYSFNNLVGINLGYLCFYPIYIVLIKYLVLLILYQVKFLKKLFCFFFLLVDFFNIFIK